MKSILPTHVRDYIQSAAIWYSCSRFRVTVQTFKILVTSKVSNPTRKYGCSRTTILDVSMCYVHNQSCTSTDQLFRCEFSIQYVFSSFAPQPSNCSWATCDCRSKTNCSCCSSVSIWIHDARSEGSVYGADSDVSASDANVIDGGEVPPNNSHMNRWHVKHWKPL